EARVKGLLRRGAGPAMGRPRDAPPRRGAGTRLAPGPGRPARPICPVVRTPRAADHARPTGEADGGTAALRREVLRPDALDEVVELLDELLVRLGFGGLLLGHLALGVDEGVAGEDRAARPGRQRD